MHRSLHDVLNFQSQSRCAKSWVPLSRQSNESQWWWLQKRITRHCAHELLCEYGQQSIEPSPKFPIQSPIITGETRIFFPAHADALPTSFHVSLVHRAFNASLKQKTGFACTMVPKKTYVQPSLLRRTFDPKVSGVLFHHRRMRKPSTGAVFRKRKF